MLLRRYIDAWLSDGPPWHEDALWDLWVLATALGEYERAFYIAAATTNPDWLYVARSCTSGFGLCFREMGEQDWGNGWKRIWMKFDAGECNPSVWFGMRDGTQRAILRVTGGSDVLGVREDSDYVISAFVKEVTWEDGEQVAGVSQMQVESVDSATAYPGPIMGPPTMPPEDGGPAYVVGDAWPRPVIEVDSV